MKKIFLVFVSLAFITSILFAPFAADAKVRVKSYFRKNGTYVQRHYRTNPDKKTFNNWSTKGNYNPYTGKIGTKKYTPKKIKW